MLRRSRDARVLATVERVLAHDESVTARGVCWAAARRARVPLLLLGRHQYDVVLTDRRLLLVSRRPRRPGADDIALVKRFSSLTLERRRGGFPLVQHRIRTNTGVRLVLEWRPRYRALSRALDTALGGE